MIQKTECLSGCAVLRFSQHATDLTPFFAAASCPDVSV